MESQDKEDRSRIIRVDAGSFVGVIWFIGWLFHDRVRAAYLVAGFPGPGHLAVLPGPGSQVRSNSIQMGR